MEDGAHPLVPYWALVKALKLDIPVITVKIFCELGRVFSFIPKTIQPISRYTLFEAWLRMSVSAKPTE